MRPSLREAIRLEAALRDRAADGGLTAELAAEWEAARRAVLAEVRSADPDDLPELLRDEVGSTAAEIEALEEGESADPEAHARRALRLGGRIRWCLGLVREVDGGGGGDPLSFLEEEIDWARRAAEDLARWEQGRARTAEELLLEARRLRSVLDGGRLDRFLSASAGQEPGATRLEAAASAWASIGEAFRLESELSASPDPPGADAPRRTEGLAALRVRLEELIERCAAALREADPAERREFLRRGVADLAEHQSAIAAERGSGGLDREIVVLRLLSERIEALLRIVEGGTGPATDAAPAEDARVVRKALARARRIRRRAGASALEARTNLRLQRAFGVRPTRWFENALFGCLLAFLALVFVETALPLDSPWLPAIHYLDLGLCIVFQVDFFTRWGFSGWSGRYFLRHFFLESLPALPLGLIIWHLDRVSELALGEARSLVLLVLLARFLRSQRILLAVVRVARVLLFLVRGMDRVVERLRGVLDRDIVLFEGDASGDPSRSRARRDLLSLETRRRKLVRNLLADLPWPARAPVLRVHLRTLEAESVAAIRIGRFEARSPLRVPGEIHLERVVEGFLECDAATVTAALGRDGAHRAARLLRLLDLPILRSLPVARRVAPAGRNPDPPEAVAAAARAVGELLEDVLSLLRFRGDLAGITTGPQVLDRVATTLIAATKRPAARLILFGGLFLLIKGVFLALSSLFSIAPGFFNALFGILVRILGIPLLILGSVCLVLLLTGRWFKRIAGEALEVYLKTADAHSYSLLKVWKLRRRAADLRAVHRSVFRPEARLRAGCVATDEEWVAFLEGGSPACDQVDDRLGGDPRFAGFLRERSLLGLLYQDFLDGPILDRDDDKTSVQLLGNLVIQEIRIQTLGLRRKDLRSLAWLDLGKDRILTLGPYFWFRFITESLTIETAKLVMEYDTSCIPLEHRDLASAEAIARFDAFLAARREGWQRAADRRASSAVQRVGEPLTTGHFSALDFLVPDPARERVVREEFGAEVLDALLRDRRWLIREIFGTRPYHLLPRSERILNPYRLYRRYLSGVRILAFPLMFPLVVSARLLFAGARQLARVVGEVLGKSPRRGARLPRTAGFDAAVRKLNRMRKPFFMEALRLRAAIDVEYLGLRLPGVSRDPEGPSLDEDLRFIGASRAERRPFDESRGAAVRDLRRFRTLLARRGWALHDLGTLLGTLDPSGRLWRHRGEVVRALVTAFVTDHGALRTRLTASESVREWVETTLGKRGGLPTRALQGLLAAVVSRLPAGRRRSRLLGACIDSTAELRDLPPGARRRLRTALVLGHPGLERILEFAVEEARDGSGTIALEQLRRVALEFPSWSRKILTARALQAITVLDVRSYRDLVWELGGY